MSRRYPALLAALLGLAGCLDRPASDGPGEVTYSVGEPVELPLPDSAWGHPVAINSNGLIVGHTYRPGDRRRHAAIWRDGVYESLHRPPWTGSLANDVNDRNEIVGYYYYRDGYDDERTSAFLLRDGALLEIGFAVTDGTGLVFSSFAYAINERQEVAGWHTQLEGEANHGLQAIVWDTRNSSVSWRFVGPEDRDSPSLATDINDLGVAVGRRVEHRATNNPLPTDDQAIFFSFFGRPSELTVGDGLCFAPGSVPAGDADGARINNRNWVVGSHEFDDICRAVRFRLDEPPLVLRGTSTSSHSHAWDVNDHDIIVGVNDGKAVFWTAEGDMVELPMLGHEMGEARGINNSNQIVGTLRPDGGPDFLPVVWQLDVDFSLDPELVEPRRSVPGS